ncbi:MAG: ankyrin repeat domain-containing protein [Hydrotalea sp. AMD]|uniref:ankyrin repeat domain-containing protein n=1 Tax=Hydrotalea sp. AMD TaxID=2501297 RepID=UPI001026DEE1|nr:ankyrin repeat domain-containing protein [Hydrotalea sp. AMD]RWZ84315.1 MAG: ankyrin repeat domain-containing protein [Hydrotalea sp. AMD]
MTSPNIQLVSAIFANDPSKIKLLLDQGIDLNDYGFFNIPPLIRTVLYGKSKALQALIEGGADKNIKDKQGRTALEVAQKYNHPEIVKILLGN